MFKSENIGVFSNAFDDIGKTWMLVTVKSGERLNTMTASWGGIGILWNMPVAFVFIRPQRYTNELIQTTELFTASFCPEEYRSALNLCGTRSGRDMDKIKEAGLTPVYDPRGYTYFEQADKVLCLRKLYDGRLRPEDAIDTGVFEKNYPNRDYHHMYIAHIEDFLRKTV